jgi:hypothetical protein
MTTPLAHEPLPGDGLVPNMSPLTHRLYHRLPEIYRVLDSRDFTWIFKRYLGGMLSTAGEVDSVIDNLIGSNPVGPAVPEPWSLSGDELEQWRSARRNVKSILGDPVNAPAAWLPWLAQLLGARLDPAASEAEQRDTIIYATSGWRGGTRSAIADAARTALTGTRYARVVPHYTAAVGGGIAEGDIWDIVIVTLDSETPDPGAVLGAVLRKGVKPAGVLLHHTTYEASWDQQEAVYPTWQDRDAATWAELAEAGLVYHPVPDNLFTTNPSFEVNATGWAARGVISAIGRVLGGLDGVGMGRVTVSAGGIGEVFFPLVDVDASTDYVMSFSLRASEVRYTQFFADWLDASDVFISSQGVVFGNAPAGEWCRPAAVLNAPAGAAKARIYVQVTGMLTSETYDLDAAFMREVA